MVQKKVFSGFDFNFLYQTPIIVYQNVKKILVEKNYRFV